MKKLIFLLFLPACSNYSLKPSFSFETSKGETFSVGLTIKPDKHSNK